MVRLVKDMRQEDLSLHWLAGHEWVEESILYRPCCWSVGLPGPSRKARLGWAGLGSTFPCGHRHDLMEVSI